MGVESWGCCCCCCRRREGGREAEQRERQRWAEREQQRIMNSIKGKELTSTCSMHTATVLFRATHNKGNMEYAERGREGERLSVGFNAFP